MIDSAATPESVSVPLHSSAETASAQPNTQPNSEPNTQPNTEPGNPRDAEPAARPHPSSDQRAPRTMSIKEAVLNCRAALLHAYNEQMAREKSEYQASKLGSQAFRRTMPLLISEGNIRAFIACVAHGILIDAIPGEDGPRLTAIARLALASLPREPKSAGRPPSTGKKSCQEN